MPKGRLSTKWATIPPATLRDGFVICRRVNGKQRFKQRLEQVEMERVGAVGFGVCGIVVHFEEQAINTGSYSGAGKERRVLMHRR